MTNSNTVNTKKILAILAHPDDEAFGMGGTLAFYATQGCEVYLITATLGEAGVVPEGFLKPGQSLGQAREAELDCSAEALGIKHVFKLGYRDSGMAGSEDNHNPNALAAQPLGAVIEKVAAIMREVKPQIVLTFDPIGGYHHPDHVRMHEAAVGAFHLVRKELNPEEEGWLQGLYFHTSQKTFFRLLLFLTQLQGKDPHKVGANGDIDLVEIAKEHFPIHAKINYRTAAEKRARAAACHASQGGGKGGGFFGSVLAKLFIRPVDFFMQAWPEPSKENKVKRDLFEGLRQ